MKDKIEAQNQVKAKEQEEKEVIAQQVISFGHFVPCSNNLVNNFYLLIKHSFNGLNFVIPNTD